METACTVPSSDIDSVAKSISVGYLTTLPSSVPFYTYLFPVRN